MEFNFLSINYFNFFTNRGQVDRARDSDDPYIPLPFVDMLRIGLAKLVGVGWLHPNLGGLQFWNTFPNKYNTVRNYERSKVKVLIAVDSFFFLTKIPFFVTEKKNASQYNQNSSETIEKKVRFW